MSSVDNLFINSGQNPFTIAVNDTTVTTSPSTGAIVLYGGLGLNVPNNATSTTNGGSLTSAGGGAFAKDFYVGGQLSAGATTVSTNGQSLVLPLSVTSNGDQAQLLFLNRNGASNLASGLTYLSTGALGSEFARFGNWSFSGGHSNAIIQNKDFASGTQFTRLSIGDGGAGVSIPSASMNLSTTDPNLTWQLHTSGLGLNWESTTSFSCRTNNVARMTFSNSLTTASTPVSITDTTDATSSSAGGSFTTSGGLAIGKKLYVGATTTSSSSTVGACVIAGGLSISSTTDATNQLGGGAFTCGGGGAFGKMLVVGGTNASTSSVTGGLIAFGGIASNNSTDATSATNGGSLTVAGGAAVAKTLYTGTGLFLPTTGGTPAILNYYEEYSPSITFTGGGTFTSTNTVYFTRIGRVVTILVKDPIASAGTTGASGISCPGSTIPTRFNPVEMTGHYLTISVHVNVNGTDGRGVVIVDPFVGRFNILNSQGAGFANGSTVIIYSFGASWSV